MPPEPSRYWGMVNLLVQFDPNGIVKNWGEVDDKSLGQQLDQYDPTTQIPPLLLSTPWRAKAQWPHSDKPGDLVLNSESFEFDNGINNGCRLKVPRSNLRMVASTPGAFDTGPFFDRDRFSDDLSHGNLLVATVYFAKSSVCSGSKGHFKTKKLAIGVDPPTFLLLRRYLKQPRPDAGSGSPRVDEMNRPASAPNGKD